MNTIRFSIFCSVVLLFAGTKSFAKVPVISGDHANIVERNQIDFTDKTTVNLQISNTILAPLLLNLGDERPYSELIVECVLTRKPYSRRKKTFPIDLVTTKNGQYTAYAQLLPQQAISLLSTVYICE